MVAGVYLATNAAFVVQRVIFDLQQGKPEEILLSLTDLAVFSGIWVLFTIPLIRLTGRLSLGPRNFFVLAVVGIFLSFLHAALYLSVCMTIPGLSTSVHIASAGEYVQAVAGLGHAWRFLSFGFLVVVSYAYDYYALSKERERRAAQLQIQLTEAKLNALKMQLHPHFLFNTLNAISVLVDENPSAAKETLAQLSDLLRLTLENVDAQEVPLRRELDFLDRYLRILKKRYEERLTVTMNISTDVIEAAVPYLVLQPIVENALRHGIDAVPGPGCIGISAARRDGELVLAVEDSGPGVGTSAREKRGIGLVNLDSRLKQLYAGRHTFLVEDIPGGRGARVTVTIPYKPA